MPQCTSHSMTFADKSHSTKVHHEKLLVIKGENFCLVLLFVAFDSLHLSYPRFKYTPLHIHHAFSSSILCSFSYLLACLMISVDDIRWHNADNCALTLRARNMIPKWLIQRYLKSQFSFPFLFLTINDVFVLLLFSSILFNI